MDEELQVTIRTPAGFGELFSVDAGERIDKVVWRAVKRFVAARQLVPGEYGLALVRDGQAIDLEETARLKDYGVGQHEILSLISKEPQVDG